MTKDVLMKKKRFYERASLMTEPVTKGMVLDCLQDIQRDLGKMKVGLATLYSEIRVMNNEMSLFLQSRLGEEQPD